MGQESPSYRSVDAGPGDGKHVDEGREPIRGDERRNHVTKSVLDDRLCDPPSMFVGARDGHDCREPAIQKNLHQDLGCGEDGRGSSKVETKERDQEKHAVSYL
jgi:hypothetical protein